MLLLSRSTCNEWHVVIQCLVQRRPNCFHLFDYFILWSLQVCSMDLEIVLIMSSDSHQWFSVQSSVCVSMLQRECFLSPTSSLFIPLPLPPHSASGESNLGRRRWVFRVLQRRHWCLHTDNQSWSAQYWERWADQQQCLLIPVGQIKDMVEGLNHRAGMEALVFDFSLCITLLTSCSHAL